MDNGVDYSRVAKDVDDNAYNSFEKGSRHPKWRGGIDETTKKNRQNTYRKFGLGVTTSRNSSHAYESSEIKANPISDFKAERRTKLNINNIPSREAVLSLIQKVLGHDAAQELKTKLPDGRPSQLVLGRRIYTVSFDFIGDSTKKSYSLFIARVGVRKARQQFSLGAIVRREKKAKEKEALPKSAHAKMRKHKNTIRGLEMFDKAQHRRKT